MAMASSDVFEGDREAWKQHKLEEFDQEVQNRIKEMRDGLDTHVAGMRLNFTRELIAIPKSVKLLTLEEFVSSYAGSIERFNNAKKEEASAKWKTLAAETPAPNTVRRGAAGRLTAQRVPQAGPLMTSTTGLITPLKRTYDDSETATTRVTRTGKRVLTDMASEINAKNAAAAETGTVRASRQASRLDSSSFVTPAICKPLGRLDNTVMRTGVKLKRGDSIVGARASMMGSVPVVTLQSSLGMMVDLTQEGNVDALKTKKAREEAVQQLAALQNQVSALMNMLTSA